VFSAEGWSIRSSSRTASGDPLVGSPRAGGVLWFHGQSTGSDVTLFILLARD